MRAAKLVGYASLALLSMSCAAHPTARHDASDVRAARAEGVSQHKEEPLLGAQVAVDPRIQSACRVRAPKFGLDSTSVDLDPALDKLARCFKHGPMKYRTLLLVGHTDPRGTPDYNRALGKQRAETVASYLESRGITGYRIETASRGEADARGTDEASWATDRRVDILLGD
ncbi:MAG: OmpA family protein [Polyangiaceae bacterium]